MLTSKLVNKLLVNIENTDTISGDLTGKTLGAIAKWTWRTWSSSTFK